MADRAPFRAKRFVPLAQLVDRVSRLLRTDLGRKKARFIEPRMAPIQFSRSAKDVDFGFCFKRPIKKCFGSQVAGSTHPDTRAMALAVSASGIVAGARFPRDALCVRRRAPEAAKVCFPRAKSSDTSRRRRTDARFPTDKWRVNRAVTTARRRRRATRVFQRVRLNSNAISSVSSLTS